MGRRITSGVAGSAGLGGLNINSTTIGTSGNTDLNLAPNGSGVVSVTTNLQIANQGDIRLLEATAGGTNYIGFQAPSAITSNVLWTLPGSDGSNDQVLATNGSGTLSWSTKSVSITDDTLTNATRYLLFTSSTSGTATAINVSSTKMTFNPNSGTFTVTSIVESSSIALKENINPIQDALSNVMQLVGVTYDRKDGSRKDEAGLIAEDVAKVLPNLVTRDEDGNVEGIQYTKLTAYLIESIKTLKSEIDRLKGN